MVRALREEGFLHSEAGAVLEHGAEAEVAALDAAIKIIRRSRYEIFY
jgi:16S rRNA G966 N2-methylase RsmD